MNLPQKAIKEEGFSGWTMPLIPQSYDRSPLSTEERTALGIIATLKPTESMSERAILAREVLRRLLQPLQDVWDLHRKPDISLKLTFRRFIVKQMDAHNSSFWEWTEEEWTELLCPTNAEFVARFGSFGLRTPTLETAYLLCNFTDFGSLGGGIDYLPMARAIFGADVIAMQCEHLKAAIIGSNGLGYVSNAATDQVLQRSLALLFLCNRSPALEALTIPLLHTAAAAAHPDIKKDISNRVTMALTKMGIVQSSPKHPLQTHAMPSRQGVPASWYEWCMAWRERVTGDLSSRVADAYLRHLILTGRWLVKHHPKVVSPEQWTEDLALEYRASLSRWCIGEYAGPRTLAVLKKRGVAGHLLKPSSIAAKLVAMRRFFEDLQNKPHRINDKPACKIPLLFKPSEAFARLRETARALENIEPRDIDPVIWRKLAGAAARLTQEDARWRNWLVNASRSEQVWPANVKHCPQS